MEGSGNSGSTSLENHLTSCDPIARPPANSFRYLIRLAVAGLLFSWTSLGFVSASWACPSTAGSVPASATKRIFLTEACADTLDVPWREAFVAAKRALVHDEWQIQRADTSTGEIVTRWKKLDHAMARLLIGNVDARCRVNVTELGPQSTLVSFRANISSVKDLTAIPRFRVAQHAYRLAAEDWHTEVREYLDLPDR